jgi:hypothetical protein
VEGGNSEIEREESPYARKETSEMKVRREKKS